MASANENAVRPAPTFTCSGTTRLWLSHASFQNFGGKFSNSKYSGIPTTSTVVFETVKLQIPTGTGYLPQEASSEAGHSPYLMHKGGSRRVLRIL